MSEPSRAEVDKFIDENDVDESAASSLRNCPPEVQRKVLARGELSSARNPSAALLTRIRDAREASAGVRNTTVARSSEDVEDFIKINDVDDSAANSLRSSSPGTQRAVLARGDLTSARNPSSALLARIRDAKSSPSGGGSDMVPHAQGHGAPCMQPPAGMPNGYPGYPGYYPGAYGSWYPGAYGAAYPGAPAQPGAAGGAAAYGSSAPGAYGASAYPGVPGYPGYPMYPGAAYGAYAGAYGMGAYGQGYPAAGGYPPTSGAPAPGGQPTPSSTRARSRGRGRARSSSSSYSRSRSRSKSRSRRNRRR
mmetsp:Transcript_47944/g.104290  ORF Transcript_47944/g.104290 Transcript_47944/m.104290 type:complete len:307 (-) Transcript_47944:172-1092(-)